MIYNLRHRTTYTYESAVSFARCVLRLTPQSSPAQTVLESSLAVTPRPSNIIERTGAFGEHTLTAVIEEPHLALVIEARSRIDVHAPSLQLTTPSPSWDEVRKRSVRDADLGPDGPAAYLYPTRRTPIAAEITEYARPSFAEGRPIMEAAGELMTRMYADFTYDSKATTVSTLAQEAFKARRGVCQDFAHIMISGLKGLGLPAAYVSGYLRTIPPPGQARLEGADATHAWAAVWCGEGLGWVGFDPTNGILAQNDHIVLARGRDYSDVAPIDGIILAPGEQTLKVEVDVIPEDELVAAMRAGGMRSPVGLGTLL
ncbi:MAG: transglutaminase family protein [Phenylobacterium sp.]|uniref:transglutaminase family protein n=1 Tax=Phenylobacterium sp. TaxID=1871053 RepID=UPI002736B31C|nr:transglutaminase family protein [Phenylobacterium sp.]MDP3174241.1 transglutaminase family protein [Phenylobacterium sp.]